ncbi:MAG: right-handed parallel beta-helix repeat-containing protein, partial [Parvibaculum sp.]|nr:right-handed parallel beta-helix repeat-containing protein [Parvibaculum sp.]
NGINLNVGNTLTLTNSSIEQSENDGLSAIADNILTLSGVTFRDIDLSAIYIDEDNTLSVSNSVFEGAIGEDILTVDGTGNTLSGSGNENTATIGNNLCTAAPGSFTGTIGFDGGPDIVDGSCP